MGKTVLITGINSYVASTLLPRLEADPGVDKIIGIDISPWKGGFPKVDFHKADLRDKSIFDLFENVDAVFHLAFGAGGKRNREKIYDTHINGSKNVFAACIDKGVRKIVYTSSLTVYGAFPDTPLGLDETASVRPNPGNRYNSCEVAVENYGANLFAGHPEVVFTVLRVGILCGPHMENGVSKRLEKTITTLPMGGHSHLQMIHETDLGEALYLTYVKDLQGIYNVAAEDAVPSKWCFRQAGVRVIPLPVILLKLLADIGFKLNLFPDNDGWTSLTRHTTFALTNKFKKASGWRPKYTSKKAFKDYLASRVRDAEDNLIQSFLSWVFVSGARIRPTMKVLHLFKLGKIKAFRDHFPWMNPRKNSMTYLPVSYAAESIPRAIPIGESIGESESTILPSKIVHDFIDKARYHVVMDHCGCRLAGECEHFTADIGCLFMGETALTLPHGVSRRVTRDQAHRHVERAVGVGLVPVVGKIRVDNFIFLTPDQNRLLSVCFCCHCCCMMGAFKYLPGSHLDHVMTPLEGVTLEVTDDCIGCGKCIETCIFDAIRVENGKARHTSQCRACGRCVSYCPRNAVKIGINNPDTSIAAAARRIESYVQVA